MKDEFEFELEFDRFELDFDKIDDLVSIREVIGFSCLSQITFPISSHCIFLNGH